MRLHRYFKVKENDIVWTWRMNVAPEWIDTASIDELSKELKMNLIEEINEEEYDELMKMDETETVAFEKWLYDRELNPHICPESLKVQFHYGVYNR